MVILQSNTFTISFEGYVKMTPNKIGLVETTSTTGVENESSIRNTYNFTLIINEISQSDYEKMQNMFLDENSFEVIDEVRNIEGGSFKIPSSNFELNEVEDKKEKGYYYTGQLNLRRI